MCFYNNIVVVLQYIAENCFCIVCKRSDNKYRLSIFMSVNVLCVFWVYPFGWLIVLWCFWFIGVGCWLFCDVFGLSVWVVDCIVMFLVYRCGLLIVLWCFWFIGVGCWLCCDVFGLSVWVVDCIVMFLPSCIC